MAVSLVFVGIEAGLQVLDGIYRLLKSEIERHLPLILWGLPPFSRPVSYTHLRAHET